MIHSPVMLNTIAATFTMLIYYFTILLLPQTTSNFHTEQDSDGFTLAHLMARYTFAKRTRQAILDINTLDLEHIISIETYVAVLHQDDSKKCLKTLHDIELIKADSHLFKISWRKMVNSTSNNCSIVFYRNGQPTGT